MVSLKKGFKKLKKVAKNPRRELHRYAAKADKAIAKSKQGKKISKTIKRVDRKIGRSAKKVGLKGVYEKGKNEIAKRSGVGKFLKGKKGLVSTALRQGEKMSGKQLRGTGYKEKKTAKKLIAYRIFTRSQNFG